jgi:uncharacterized protein YcsI (UPF0317 family)
MCESQIVTGGGALNLGVKRLGREADHSSPSSAEAKNMWSCNFTPQYIIMASCLTKRQLLLHGVVSS